MNLLKNITFPCVLMFFAGALVRIDFHLIGRFAVGEIVLLSVLPFAVGQIGSLRREPKLKLLLYTLLIWILGVILSDIFNGNHFMLFIRGLARPVICLCILIAAYYLMKRDSRCIYFFFIGLLLSGIANFIAPTDFRVSEHADLSQISAMSYGTRAFAITPLVYAIASVGGFILFRASGVLSGVFQILVALAVATILSRTTTGTLFISGLIIIGSSFLPGIGRLFLSEGRIRTTALVASCILLSILFTLVYYLYAYCAYNYLLGEAQYNKFINQTNTVFGNTPWGVLASGRHYTMAAILRIIDNPILGAGSWPQAGDTLVRTFQLLGVYNIDPMMNDPYRREIGHSVIFGIWAQNGILVIPFMVFSAVSSAKLFIRNLIFQSAITPLLVPYLLVFLFSLFFNNFNSLVRLEMIFFPLLYYMARPHMARPHMARP